MRAHWRCASEYPDSVLEATLQLLGHTGLCRQIALLDDLDHVGAMLAGDEWMLPALDAVDRVQDVGIDVRLRDAGVGLGHVWQPCCRRVRAVVQPLQSRGFRRAVCPVDREPRRMPGERFDL